MVDFLGDKGGLPTCSVIAEVLHLPNEDPNSDYALKLRTSPRSAVGITMVGYDPFENKISTGTLHYRESRILDFRRGIGLSKFMPCQNIQDMLDRDFLDVISLERYLEFFFKESLSEIHRRELSELAEDHKKVYLVTKDGDKQMKLKSVDGLGQRIKGAIGDLASDLGPKIPAPQGANYLNN